MGGNASEWPNASFLRGAFSFLDGDGQTVDDKLGNRVRGEHDDEPYRAGNDDLPALAGLICVATGDHHQKTTIDDRDDHENTEKPENDADDIFDRRLDVLRTEIGKTGRELYRRRRICARSYKKYGEQAEL